MSMDTLTKLLFLHQNADLDHLQQALKEEDFRAERDQLRAVRRATEELRTLQAAESDVAHGWTGGSSDPTAPSPAVGSNEQAPPAWVPLA